MTDTTSRHPNTEQLLRYFDSSHLHVPLADISRQVGTLARDMVAQLPDCPELSAGLRKLLEAKDCLVRAALDIERN